jgi:hypothetical protein
MSTSSRALHALLEEGGEQAEAVKLVAHRTVLWRYRNGNGKPDVVTATKLERASEGRVPANGWEDDAAEAKSSPHAAPGKEGAA